MKNSILILSLFSCVLLSSCSKQWCYTKWPISVDSIYKEIIRDSIVIKDTIVYIHLPGETVIDSVKIPCPDPGPAYVPKKVRSETSLAWAEAWFQFPNIKLLLVQKDTTIIQRLDAAIKEAYYWKSEYQKITVKPEPVKFIPGFYKFCTFAFIGSILSVVAFILFKLFLR